MYADHLWSRVFGAVTGSREWRSRVRARSLDTNILGASDPITLYLVSFESPWLGLYRRKESSRIGSLGPEILAFKDRVRCLPLIYAWYWVGLPLFMQTTITVAH